jgi:hypothetical protein
MGNVKRLGQECWLVDNVKFASGQRSYCQKRWLLKLANETCGDHIAVTSLIIRRQERALITFSAIFFIPSNHQQLKEIFASIYSIHS